MIRPIAVLLVAGVALAAVSLGAEQAASPKALMNPARLKAQAPAAYKVKFDTSVGEFVVQVTRDWAPNGADRFFNLVKHGFYNDVRFFRASRTSWCSSASTASRRYPRWRNAQIPARSGQAVEQARLRDLRDRGSPRRTTQVFINFSDNAILDRSLRAVRRDRQRHGRRGQDLHGIRRGRAAGQRPRSGPDPGRGQRVSDQELPELDYIKKATVE